MIVSVVQHNRIAEKYRGLVIVSLTVCPNPHTPGPDPEVEEERS